MEFNATFIVAFISFIVFTVIMNLILYKPLNKVVTERQKVIDEHYEEAKLNKKKSESMLRDKERKLEATKHDAKKIIVDKTDEVKSKKSALALEAQQKALQVIDGAKEELQKSKSEAQEVLSDNVVDLAQEISSKILGENVEITNVDKDLITKAIKGRE